MINFTEYDDKCWWCGNFADTAEHIYKKTDLEREFGRRQIFKSNQPVRFKNKDYPTIEIETPKAKTVKFQKNLCANCNSIRSQPHDYAYDKFVSYFKKNEHSIYLNQVIDFFEIYGQNWENEYYNLLRYYTKNFCCRLQSYNIEICDDLILFLDNNLIMESLKLRIYLRSDIYEFLKLTDSGFLHNGGFFTKQSDNSESLLSIESTTSYRSLTIGYFYSKEIESPFWNYTPEPKLYLPKWNSSNGYK